MGKIQNHLKENWIKYIIEIVVVTLGILLAFQLENWNQNQKKKETEIHTLNQFVYSLKRLQNEVEINLEDEENVYTSCLYILENFETNGGLDDSLGVALTLAWFYTHLQPDFTTYDNLKSIGPNILSNDSLKEELLNFYGLDLQATVSESRIRQNYVESLKDGMGKWLMSLNSNTVYTGPSLPVNYDLLRSDNEFLFHIRTQLNESKRWKRELEGLIGHIEKLVFEIEKEIKILQ